MTTSSPRRGPARAPGVARRPPTFIVPPGRSLAIFLFFSSGGCALIYETLWLRLLKLVFGNTATATSVTLALFMSGLAFGALFARSRVDAVDNKMRAYGVIEICVGLSALGTLPALAWIDPAYVHIYRSWTSAPSLLLCVQILLSSTVLLVPTCLMGITLPLLSALPTDGRDGIGLRFGILYASNTLGAVLGAFAAGFFLVGTLGVGNTLYVAASINFVTGAAAVVFSSRGRRRREPATVHQAALRETALRGAALGEMAPGTREGGAGRMVDAWLFISGFVAMGYEVIWIRTSITYLKATTYAFSAILCVYLLGYAAGIGGGGLLARRVTHPLRVSRWLMQATGICGIFYVTQLVCVSNALSITFSVWTNHLLYDLGRYFTLLYSAVLFFVPSVIMGLNVPLLVELRKRSRPEPPGSAVATAYFINTIGSVAGPLITGFCLVPWFGSQRAIQSLGLLGIASVLLPLRRRERAGPYVPHLAVLGVSGAFVVLGPSHAYAAWLNQIEGKDQATELMDVIEGVTTTATVHHYVAQNFNVITTAGINVAGDHIALRQTQKAQGHIPVILHGRPTRVLTVGFGSGELTKLLTMHEIPQITCVELSPEVVTLSRRHFSSINLGDALEKHVTMVYMDAKNFIHLTSARYDVILNDAIWPGLFAENSSLYTKEYFMDGKDRLDDDGVYSTWLPLSLSEQSLKSILRTFSDVFENTLLIFPHFTPSPHALLIGQKTMHRYSYDSMRQELGRAAVTDSLRMIGVTSVDDILESVFAAEGSIKQWSAGAPINSDDFPIVEFDRSLYREAFNNMLAWENLYKMMLVMPPPDLGRLLAFDDDDLRERVIGGLENRQRAVGHLLMSFMYLDPEKNSREVAEGLAIEPTNASLLHRRDVLSEKR